MKYYLVTYEYPYEGNDILGLYADLSEAKRACENKRALADYNYCLIHGVEVGVTQESPNNNPLWEYGTNGWSKYK